MADHHWRSKNEAKQMESLKSKPYSSNTYHQSSSSSYFHRSMTIHQSSSSPITEITNKPLQNLYDNASTFQRNGSIKNLHTSNHHPYSSFNSILKNKVRKLCSIFEKHHPQQHDQNPRNAPEDPTLALPRTEDRVVIYFTSLRGVRKTFQDCHSVRMIFHGFRINVDERDVSMDSEYRKELQNILGNKNNDVVLLPQVFVKGKYIGGVDMVKHLLESGDLGKLIKEIPLCNSRPCEACGDARFLPCENCSGSRKVFDDDEGKYRRCWKCNENGLVRCPLCCY